MLGWPNHPIRGGRPPRLAWGWFGPPLGPNLQKTPKPNEVAGHPLWGGLATPTYFFFFFFLFGYIYMMGAFWGKKVRMVELQQFESLGGSSVTF